MADELDLSTVRVEGTLVPVSHADVDVLEQELGVTLPKGYREYVTLLGEGSLDALVRVLPPWQVRRQLDEHQGRMSTYWFWGGAVEGFGQDEATASIPIADTLSGDAVAYWPSDPGHLFVLPRDADDVLALPGNLLQLIAWICAGGLEDEPSEEHTFQAWDSRMAATSERAQPPATPAPDLTRSPREVLLAYFAELAQVEVWAAAQWPGSDDTPVDRLTDEMIQALDERVARTEVVNARYGTAMFAAGQRGSSVSMSDPPRHAAGGVTIIEEQDLRPGLVHIKALDGGSDPNVNDYRLEQTAGEWRIKSQKPDFEYLPPGPTRA